MYKKRSNVLRAIFQIGVIAFIAIFGFKIFGNEKFDPEAYCPFGGLQTLGTYLVRGSMACSMTTTQISMGILLAIGVILFSKLFCSYLCPLGTLGEYMAKLRKRLKIKELTIVNGSIADKILRIVKYILLFLVFYMTLSSSELFCKNFDPYYAFATGFKGELTVWMACISIVICFLGNFIINMFWCKYICPLGALSNIFKFTITFIAYLAIFAILNLFGIYVSWVILLAVTCVTGYIFEIVYMKSKVFPALTIVRDTETCNGCGVCAKKCPYSINIDKVEKVKHIDCMSCGECIESCPKKSLSFNNVTILKWLPALAVVIMFFLGIYLGKTVELPTIDEQWGAPEKYENSEKIVVEGLRSVKCFGSSKAFSAQLQKIPGVYGVATYVKHFRVNIYFDPTETTEEAIRRAIYVPAKFKINHPPKEDSLIKVITIRTENMHDKLDPNYLGMQFRNSGKNYFGLETEYDCPIIVRLYMGLDEPIDKSFIKSMVEMKKLEMPVHGGGTKEIEVDYKLVEVEPAIDTITRKEFLVRQFNAISRKFTENAEKYDGMPITTYEIEYRDLDKPMIARNIPYLSSYLSLKDGIVSFDVLVNDNEDYVVRIGYVEPQMNDTKLWDLINEPEWDVKMKDGSIVNEAAKVKFPNQGKIISSKN